MIIMSAEADSDRGSTYVGFDMEEPDDKQALRVASAKAGYSSVAAYLREIVYSEVDELERSE